MLHGIHLGEERRAKFAGKYIDKRSPSSRISPESTFIRVVTSHFDRRTGSSQRIMGKAGISPRFSISLVLAQFRVLDVSLGLFCAVAFAPTGGKKAARLGRLTAF